jgi:hypothetical protein
MHSRRNLGSLTIGLHSFRMRWVRKLGLVLRRWSYHWLFRTFSAGVSCNLPEECALLGTGAACIDVAAKAVRPIIVAMITRIQLSLTGRMCACQFSPGRLGSAPLVVFHNAAAPLAFVQDRGEVAPGFVA